VKFGVTFILCAHLFECVLTAVLTAVFIIGRWPSLFVYTFSDIGVQTAFACFALAGIPIILVGLWGVRHGVEVCLRCYFFYMLLSFIVDVIYATNKFIFHHTCDEIPNVMAQQGRAWACGMSRIFDISSFIMLMAIPAYFIFIVYSYCEDMTEGGSGPDLSDLTSTGFKAQRKHPGFDPYQTVLGLNDYVTGEYGATYFNQKAPAGLGGGQPIMNGKYHEMDFPPKLGHF
jgi:hypothetical protein